MEKRKCLGKLVAVEHDKIFELGMDLSACINNGKTLWIEGTYPWAFNTNLYFQITKLAKQHGMKIVYLDRGKIHAVGNRVFSAAVQNIVKMGKERMPESLYHTISEYTNKILRERKWAILLRKAKAGDVIVMHPIHAHRIAPALEIPYKEVIWMHQPNPRELRNSAEDLSQNRIKKFWELRKQEREKRLQAKPKMRTKPK